MMPPPEPIDLPTCCSPSSGDWKYFKIKIVHGKPYPYKIEAKATRFLDSWSFYANASSLDAAFEMIPKDRWNSTKVTYACDCPFRTPGCWTTLKEKFV